MGGVAGALILGIVGSILHGELAAWAPRICHFLIGCAVWVAPDELRERLREEWTADIERIPGPYSKLIYVIGIWVAGLRIGAEDYVDRTFSWISEIGFAGFIERACAALLIAFYAPLFITVAFIISLSGKRVFKLVNCGPPENRYGILKFNVRPENCIGSILVKTGVDGLPMIINVLRGDIAFFTSLDAGGLGYYRDPLVMRIVAYRNCEISRRIASLLWEYRRQPSAKLFILLSFFSFLSLITVDA